LKKTGGLLTFRFYGYIVNFIGIKKLTKNKLFQNWWWDSNFYSEELYFY